MSPERTTRQHNGVKRRFSDQDRTVTAVDTDEINVLKEKFEKATGQAASDGGINKQQARESPDNIKRKNDDFCFSAQKGSYSFPFAVAPGARAG